MTNEPINPDELMPEGTAYISYTFQRHTKCEITSMATIDKLGDGIPGTIEKLGTVLSLLDRLASCLWGCHGLEHAIEYLVGRTLSFSIAALRLVNLGHYDEALALTRSITEIGNLMQLFMEDPSALRRWIDASNKNEREEFEPYWVREALKMHGSVVPTNEAHYGLLCQIAIHPNPKTSPQSHNENRIPTLGGYYQERGQIVCLNEIAWAVATVAGPAAKIAVVRPDKAKMILEATISLVKTLGQVSLSNKQAASQYKESTGSSERLLVLTEFLDQTLRQD